MNPRFADWVNNVQETFVREILKVAANPQAISFAWGFPNPSSFPIQELQNAAQKVLSENGRSALQYSSAQGHLPLRQYIANRYLEKKGIKVDPGEILITSGSQQGLDLIGKILLNKGENVLIERPAYVGAILAFSVFEPQLRSIPLLDDGIDTGLLNEALKEYNPKLFYAVPNFQNPSGITYTRENREKTAEILENHDTIFIEDDPYGELRFIGQDLPSMKTYLADNVILLGSFSKTVAPGLRLGWICAPPQIMEKLLIAKQGSDMLTNYFSQCVVHQYLMDNDADSHIEGIRALLKEQRDFMLSAIDEHFPEEIEITRPEGGIFLWSTLPEGLSSVELFSYAAKENVIFVPGDAFYVNMKNTNTLRLNYTGSNEETIKEGIKRLAKAINQFMSDKII